MEAKMSELKSHSPDHQSELINKSPSNPSLHLEEAWGSSVGNAWYLPTARKSDLRANSSEMRSSILE